MFDNEMFKHHKHAFLTPELQTKLTAKVKKESMTDEN